MKKKLTLLIALSSVVIAGGIVFASAATTTKKDNKPKETVVQIETKAKEEEVNEEPPQQQEMVVLKTNEEIAQEVIDGAWGSGEDRINRLTKAGYNPNEIQELVNSLYSQAPPRTTSFYNSPPGGCLTMSGGVYDNPETGLHETWYSQRVLPGGGLNIPGRHVNEEGFVCDGEGYICLATNINQYPTGAIINTSRGIGKVYDHGCAWGTLDVYVDW